MPQYSELDILPKMKDNGEVAMEALLRFNSGIRTAIEIDDRMGGSGVDDWTNLNDTEAMMDAALGEVDAEGLKYPGVHDVYEESLKNLEEFDVALSNLVALRMRLSSETGIPLRLTGGKEWYRTFELLM